MLEKNSLDRISTDLVSQVVERSSDSGVAPTRIVASHSEDQLPDFSRSSWTTGASALAPIILSRDQLPVPSEQSIRVIRVCIWKSPFLPLAIEGLAPKELNS